MKYISFITIILILFSVNNINGQDNFVQLNSKNMRDSIETVVKNFGKSVDLHFEPGEFELSFPERENNYGNKLFSSLFDTVNYNENIFNFIDPKFVNVYLEAQEECKTCECWETIFGQLIQDQNYKMYLSMREYIDLYREIYLTKGVPSSVLEGSFGAIDSSRILWDGTTKRNFGKRYSATVSAPFNFGGVFLSERNSAGNREPVNFQMEELELFFEVSFTKVKNTVGDYKIDKVYFVPPKCTPPQEQKYIFSVTPFVNIGSMQPDFVSTNSALNSQLEIPNTPGQEIGIHIERKLKLFNKNYVELVIGTGGEFKRLNVTSKLKSYNENNVGAQKPFNPSTNLNSFTLKSQANNLEFTDNSWFFGLPVRIGLGVPLKSDNSVRLYINSEISYLLPVKSASEASGDIVSTGEFVYETNGVFTTILMTGDNSNGPHSNWNYNFGDYNVTSNKNIEFNSGYEVKSQLGITIPFSQSYNLNVGGYFSVGSVQLKENASELIFSPEGKTNSPLTTTEKFNYVSFGLNLSATFDFYKLVSAK